MKLLHWFYPSMVGILLGLLQTGLFFQLAFTLSSGYRTFLMVTVCWLLGSVTGIVIANRIKLSLNGFAVLSLLAYFGCVILLDIAPFDTQLWLIYALLIVVSGFYPGVFFIRLSNYYTTQTLFFRENNGFILGLVAGTLLFILSGRVALWGAPILIAVLVMVCTTSFFRNPMPMLRERDA